LKQRRDWFASRLDLDPAKLVFIGKTGASTNLARKGGRCRRCQRLRAGVPHGHYKTVTLAAGVRLRKLLAAQVYGRPINAALFEERAEQCLVPALPQDGIAVIGNLPARKMPRAKNP
jgi:hypothetical protein